MFSKYNEQLIKAKKDMALNTDEICIAFNNAFLNCNEELFNGMMDIRFSGSTCVSIMTLGQKLFCVNVGDSRGIVVKIQNGDKVIAQAISRDQKPSQQDEANRIIQCGGRIDSFRDPENKNPIGPLRVWLKNDDIPGLAMTRSFGDEVASRVGVTAEPGKFEFSNLIPNSNFSNSCSQAMASNLDGSGTVNDYLMCSLDAPFFVCRDTGTGPVQG